MIQQAKRAVSRLLGLDPGYDDRVTAKARERYEAAIGGMVNARYDAAGDSDEFAKYWAEADYLDADSANDRYVREKLVSRSRYETSNNGYVDGMVTVHADYLVGTGPKLKLKSASENFNRMVERRWNQWAKAINFRRKLHTMARAYDTDGEAFGIIRSNPNVRAPVQLDLQLLEAEHCQTPNLPFLEPGWIDGIRFDDFGNPIWYDILPYHPGRYGNAQPVAMFGNEPQRVPAEFVCHWFAADRPGQHRGVPLGTSTLNCGASSRRWREAILAAAESAAEFNILLKTITTPEDDDMILAEPFSKMELVRRMITALPPGYEAQQMKSEHPGSQYSDFHKAQINEQGRSRVMPVNVATGDSSSHNFASGRLDHLPWHQHMTVERHDCNDTVLDVLFVQWFTEARRVFGWGIGSTFDEPTPPHTWDWPLLPIADEKAKAQADSVNLSNGTATLGSIYAAKGMDYNDAVEMMADEYGVSVDEMKATLRQAVFKATPTGTAQQLTDSDIPEGNTDGNTQTTPQTSGNQGVAGRTETADSA